MRTALLRLFLGAAASALLVAGCGGGDVSPNAGEVRLVNATGEFGALDFYADSDRLTSGVAAFAAGNYEDLDNDDYTLSVRGGAAGATIATLDASINKNTRYALVAYSSKGTPTLALLEEEEDEPDRGSAALRFFNTAAADSGNVDIYLLALADTCASLVGTAVTPVATAVSGLQASFTTLNPSPSEGYRMCVTAANAKADLRLDATLVIGDRQTATVILSRTSGVLLNGLVLVQDGPLTQALNASARVRLAIGLTGANTVTTMVGGVTLGAASLSPGTVTNYTSVPAGAVTAEVSINAGNSVGTQLTLTGGADYTLLVAGTSPVPTLIVDDNRLSTDAAKPVKIRYLNGTNGAATGSLGPARLTVNSTPLDATEFRAASPYVFLESSANTAIPLEVRTTSGTVLCTAMKTLSATPTVSTVFTLGDPGTTPTCLAFTDR